MTTSPVASETVFQLHTSYYEGHSVNNAHYLLFYLHVYFILGSISLQSFCVVHCLLTTNCTTVHCLLTTNCTTVHCLLTTNCTTVHCLLTTNCNTVHCLLTTNCTTVHCLLTTNCTTVHCLLTTNFTQSTVNLCKVFATYSSSLDV
jgi:hypothetical protein